MRLIKLLTNLLLAVLLALSASATVSAKVASGPQNLGGQVHQDQIVVNALMHQGKTESSYGGMSGSSVVAKGAGEATGFLGSKRLQLQNAPYQQVRNAPATIGGREYSAHALDQIQNRGFVPSVVENAIQNGVASPGKYAGSTQYLDAANNLRVIVNSETGRVVTVIPGVK